MTTAQLALAQNPCILGLIPARGGSKGIPRKNIKLLNGKPLIYYSILAGKNCKAIDRLVLSTDDPEIAEIAQSYGADVPFLRPMELASDTARALGVIRHAIQFLEELDKKEYPIVVYLEPTSPLRSVQDIDQAIEVFLNDTADSLASVVEVPQYHPILMKKIIDNRIQPFYLDEPEGMPRQLYAPKAYMRNGCVYIFRRSNILKNIVWGENIMPFIMPPYRSITIDDMNDWHLAEILIKKVAEQQ